MGKSKTHKGLAKRVKVTSKGKVLRKKAGTSHLLSSKSPKRRRKLRKTTVVAGKDASNIKQLLNK